MKIALGTTNITKVQAVEEVLAEYPLVAKAKLVSVSVPSEISEQPLSLEEIITGAKNRAINAFKEVHGSTYSFGIESGLFEAKGTETGYLEACICIIYDGTNYHTGLSCGFEVPKQILSHVLNDQLDLTQAALKSGITNNPTLGSAEGIIGILTRGRVNRKEYTKQCIRTALIQIENPTLYDDKKQR